jgi:hypothetical protein
VGAPQRCARLSRCDCAEGSRPLDIPPARCDRCRTVVKVPVHKGTQGYTSTRFAKMAETPFTCHTDYLQRMTAARCRAQHERADAPRPFEAAWRARNPTTSATEIAVSTSLPTLHRGPSRAYRRRDNHQARAPPARSCACAKALAETHLGVPAASQRQLICYSQNWALRVGQLPRAVYIYRTACMELVRAAS